MPVAVAVGTRVVLLAALAAASRAATRAAPGGLVTPERMTPEPAVGPVAQPGRTSGFPVAAMPTGSGVAAPRPVPGVAAKTAARWPVAEPAASVMAPEAPARAVARGPARVAVRVVAAPVGAVVPASAAAQVPAAARGSVGVRVEAVAARAPVVAVVSVVRCLAAAPGRPLEPGTWLGGSG
jgi:hypothetical protein